jgi:hypothetical protein
MDTVVTTLDVLTQSMELAFASGTAFGMIVETLAIFAAIWLRRRKRGGTP